MIINFSPAEIGVIVGALSEYDSNVCSQSDIRFLIQQLCDEVYKNLGSEFYDMWIDEFEIEV